MNPKKICGECSLPPEGTTDEACCMELHRRARPKYLPCLQPIPFVCKTSLSWYEIISESQIKSLASKYSQIFVPLLFSRSVSIQHLFGGLQLQADAGCSSPVDSFLHQALKLWWFGRLQPGTFLLGLVLVPHSCCTPFPPPTTLLPCHFSKTLLRKILGLGLLCVLSILNPDLNPLIIICTGCPGHCHPADQLLVWLSSSK